MLPRCSNCGNPLYPPDPVCRRCGTVHQYPAVAPQGSSDGLLAIVIILLLIFVVAPVVIVLIFFGALGVACTSAFGFVPILWAALHARTRSLRRGLDASR